MVPDLMEYRYETEPFRHQQDEFLAHRDDEAWGELWEQGTGKTKPIIDTAAWMFERNKIDALVVVAPSGVHRNWATDELPAHFPSRLRRRSKMKFWESKKAKQVGYKRELDELLKYKGMSILLLSYEGFTTEACKKYLWKFLKRRRVMYVLDEAHYIKTPGAKRTKSIIASGKWAGHRRILTGTPIAQGPFDLYSQIRFLDPMLFKRRGIGDFHAFKQRYAKWFTSKEAYDLLGFEPDWPMIKEYKNLQELAGILKGVSSRYLKADVLPNLPPKLYRKRYVEMNPEQARAYKELKSDYMLDLGDGQMVDGSLAIVRMLRLQQIAGGYVPTEGVLDSEQPTVRLGTTNPRLDALMAELETRTHGVIVWSRFTMDIDLIMERLQADGYTAVRYDGTLSDDEAAESKRKFQAGEAQIFVGNPQKGATGLTLIQAKAMIFYANSFKYVERVQAEDRAHRIGQEDPVEYVDLIIPDTVDEHVVRNLREKRDIAAQLTGDKILEWI